MKAIKVYDQLTARTIFVNGVFQVSPEIADGIIRKEGYGSPENKTVWYHPKTKKAYIFHHTDVWGRGSGEEINAELPEEEVQRIEKYAKNRAKILLTLFSIPHERKGDNYIYFNHPVSDYRYYEAEYMPNVLSKYPQIEKIEKLGGSVRIGERDLSVE